MIDVLEPLSQWAVATFGQDFQDFSIKKGRNIFEITKVQNDKKSLQFILHYQADGQKAERGFDLSEGGDLREDIDIWAGGRIAQMEYILISERTFSDFFLNVRKVLRKQKAQISQDLKWNKDDRDLHQAFSTVKDQIHQAFLDGINTPRIIDLLKEIIGKVNLYIVRPVDQQKAQILVPIAKYVTHILSVFGLVDGDDDDEFGFPWEHSHPPSIEKPVAQLLDTFCSIRDKVRDVARSSLRAKGKDSEAARSALSSICNSNSLPTLDDPIAQKIHNTISGFISEISSQLDVFTSNPQQLLELTDKIRDDVVPFLGIRFEDEQDATSSWKLDDTRATLRDRETRRRELLSQEQRRLEKERQKREREELQLKKKLEKEEMERKKQQELVEKSKIPPADLFKQWKDYVGKFSAFDESGFPTLDLNSKPLSNKSVKTLQKDLETQKKLHADFLAKSAV